MLDLFKDIDKTVCLFLKFNLGFSTKNRKNNTIYVEAISFKDNFLN